MHRAARILRLATLGLVLAGTALWPAYAQRRPGGWPGVFNNRNGVPVWEVDPNFKDDVFTFVRLRYGGGGDRWYIDAPDADLNLAFRLQQMTSMKVHPFEVNVAANLRELSQYPFIYMVEPGLLYFTPEEAANLRAYLLNGGFLMVDDFWGEDQWEGFYDEFRKVFPELESDVRRTAAEERPGLVTIRELSFEHPIFHCVFDLPLKPQVPAIGHESLDVTYEPRWYYGPMRDTASHFRGVFDPKGRLIALICHNTDLGDGWEREGMNIEYFKKFSEPLAYPMAINILFYTMTH